MTNQYLSLLNRRTIRTCVCAKCGGELVERYCVVECGTCASRGTVTRITVAQAVHERLTLADSERTAARLRGQVVEFQGLPAEVEKDYK